MDIAKESSDMFLPLKAVMGAISVLMKNYDVGLCRSRPELLLTHRLLPILAKNG